MNYTPIRMVSLIFLMLFLFSSPSFGASQTPVSQPQTDTTTSQVPQTALNDAPRPLPPFIPIAENYRWKSNDRYIISNISGFSGSYIAGDEINFSVEGQADTLDVSLDNGFDVNVLLYETTQITGRYVDIDHDKNNRSWKVTFRAPLDKEKTYHIGVVLYCKKTGSPCDAAFGAGTQRTSVLQLQIL